MKLRISEHLTLPLDVVTQTIAILAKRRAGKSYAMRRLAEQLFIAGQQIVIVDPKGDQWGIRSSADGKFPGLAVVILGGERGDVPLEPSGGEVVAKLVVEERVSVLLDLSPFRKHEVATFMTAFMENLYRLKAQERYRTPMMLVIDEADAIAPQKPQKGEERMLGAAEDIVRRGGQRGIGCVLVTQRSAVLNKNVLTQAQMLVALRTIAPQDLAAMNAWIDVHGTDEQKKTLMESLPSLPIGDAWFWSPGWPTIDGIFKRVHVLPIETFDSGATPAPGEKRVEPKKAADVDLDALKRQMSATIEKAKADDPKELRRKIADLEKKLKAVPEPVKEKEPVEVPVLKPGELELAKEIVERAEKVSAEMREAYWPLADAIAKTTGAARARTTPVIHQKPVLSQKKPQIIHQKPKSIHETGDSSHELTGPEQRILDALAWMESIGVAEPEQPAAAFLAGYTTGGGSWNNPKGSLRGKGLIEYLSGGCLRLTDAGRAVANFPASPASNAELHAKIKAKLPGPENKLLDVLLAIYPEDISAEELAEQTGYAFGGGSFNNPKGRLRTLGLAEYPSQGRVRARDILFPEG